MAKKVKKAADEASPAKWMIVLPGDAGKTMPIHVDGEMIRYPCGEPIEASDALRAELDRRNIRYEIA